MIEWRLPDELIERWHKYRSGWLGDTDDVVKFVLGACGVCKGSGEVLYWNPSGMKASRPCGVCHATGLDGVEWHCTEFDKWARFDGRHDLCTQADPHLPDCGLVLVIDLSEKS